MTNNKASLPQPEPMPGSDVVYEYVMDDIQARVDDGYAKYGTYLMTNNGREALWDSYQKLIDLLFYMRQYIIEQENRTGNNMTLNDYQAQCLRTANVDWSWREKVLNATLGLGETGELQNLIKKDLFHNHNMPDMRDKVREELGDIMWYVAVLADLYEIDLEEVTSHNIEKLYKRYPNGFNCEDSKLRKDKEL